MPSPHRSDGDALRCGDRSAAVTEIRAALAALPMVVGVVRIPRFDGAR